MSTPLHVTTTGSATGSAATLLFVHGVDSDSEVWAPTIDLLSDHLCVSADLPGHGKSPDSTEPSAYERSAILEDLDAVISELSRPVVFVGHSLGGYLAMAYALTRPGAVDALVLVSTGPGFRDPQARDGWNSRLLKNSPSYGVSELAATVGLHVDSMVIDRMTELTLPIALVIGEGDRAYLGANDYMEKKLPHATRTTVEGARHYVMRSHPDRVSSAIRNIAASLRRN
ncbi:MAG: alpha/beta fold hydrolase [Acidimicrobiaceae bacterium]|nr:alpha/beta fold hydrolase [Acidimicrobiaceae bacterium]